MAKTLPDKTIPQPLYSQIAEWIREQISTKEWAEHEQLPSEEDLSKELGVSRGTLRKALSYVIQEGLLVQVQGKGTFVAKRKLSHPFGQELISFAESMEREGITFTTFIIDKQVLIPKASVIEKLCLNKDEEVLFLKRVRCIDGEPVIVMDNYIRLSLCEGLQHIDFETHTLFSQIERLAGRKIKSGVRSFEARALEEEQAELLGLHPGEPVLYFDQLTWMEGDVPVEASKVWLRSDKYVITSVLKR